MKRRTYIKPQSFRSHLFLKLLFGFSLIAITFLAFNYFNKDRNDQNLNHNNFAYIKTASDTSSLSSPVSVNSWYAKYGKLMATILKISAAAQTSAKTNQFFVLSNSCQQLEANMVAASQAPNIPNSAAQETWNNAQRYYNSATKICYQLHDTGYNLSATQLQLVLNDLNQGDKQLSDSITTIENCC